VTRPSDDTFMWSWDDDDPFGVTAANESPEGQGTFRYDFRFPGQQYDPETGTHYNYFRDYDPRTGRYFQSDPIGTSRGEAMYGYVGHNPLRRIDPKGMFWFAPPGEPPGSGCGDERTDRWVPDNPLGFRFLSACRTHDRCYDTCGTIRQSCDMEFRRMLISICMSYGMNTTCTNLALAYYSTVSSEGESAYQRAQQKCNQCFIGTPPSVTAFSDVSIPTF